MIMGSLIDDIKRHEGLRLKPYMDTEGVLTIGYGHNLEEGISQDIAEYILASDIATHVMELKDNFPVVMELSTDRREVLINMTFNLGINRLKGFKKMWAAIKLRKYDVASVEMLNSKWANQVGNRAVELAEIMRGGRK